MTTPVRRWVRALWRRLAGGRPLPVGGLARDRRLLRRGLGAGDHGRVVVVGHGLAVTQALPGVHVDVVGTSPYDPHVTVCSTLATAHSLPRARWDTVVVTDPGFPAADLPVVLLPACRPRARLVLFERTNGSPDPGSVHAAADGRALGPPERRLVRRGRRLTVLRLPS